MTGRLCFFISEVFASQRGSLLGYECRCRAGLVEPDCVNPCALAQCNNGGTCVLDILNPGCSARLPRNCTYCNWYRLGLFVSLSFFFFCLVIHLLSFYPAKMASSATSVSTPQRPCPRHRRGGSARGRFTTTTCVIVGAEFPTRRARPVTAVMGAACCITTRMGSGTPSVCLGFAATTRYSVLSPCFPLFLRMVRT